MKHHRSHFAGILFAALLLVGAAARDAHAVAGCGNGSINAQNESCDDGNTNPGDGCSATCTIETGWFCSGAPSVCNLIVCGDGLVQDSEVCDQGAANGTTASCCSATCTLKAGGTVCRPAAGVCDAADTCSGSSPTCPTDAKLTSVCRAAAGFCDVAENCDGTGDDCPADQFEAAGTECRGVAGICDVAETCSGTGAFCPADQKSTGECSGPNGACDVAESCNGTDNDCPVNTKAVSGTVCRPVVNPVCDVEENCDGISDQCPDDQLLHCGDADDVDCTVSAWPAPSTAAS